MSKIEIKKVGILYHPLIKEAPAVADRLGAFLGRQGVAVWLGSAWQADEARARLYGTDLIVTVGGDGTILRANQLVAPQRIPITGINLGRLGFMTEFATGEAEAGLAALFKGEGWLDERAMLEAELTCDGKKQRFIALNDVVLARGAVARVVFIEVTVNGEKLAGYRCDGVIVATATGSTGYVLAAGGPILYPAAPELILLPVAPHLSRPFPLVLPPDAVVGLTLSTVHPGTLSVDGHLNLPLETGAALTVKRSDITGRFLRLHPASGFYSSLELKLKGKQ